MFRPTDDGKGMIRLRFSSAPDAPAIVAATNSHDRYFGAIGAGPQQLTTSYVNPLLRRKALSPHF